MKYKLTHTKFFGCLPTKCRIYHLELQSSHADVKRLKHFTEAFYKGRKFEMSFKTEAFYKA